MTKVAKTWLFRQVFGLMLLGCLWVVPALAQTLPDNTRVVVRLDSTVSSSTANVGDVVPMTLARDLLLDGRVLAPSGTPVRGTVTYVKRSGRLHDPGYITVRLSSIEIRGDRYDLHSTAIRDKGEGHTKSNLLKIGGGTGVGALIGALAGGGKGALIGSLAGAGAGTGLAAATGKKAAELSAESTYVFHLTESAQPR